MVLEERDFQLDQADVQKINYDLVPLVLSAAIEVGGDDLAGSSRPKTIKIHPNEIKKLAAQVLTQRGETAGVTLEKVVGYSAMYLATRALVSQFPEQQDAEGTISRIHKRAVEFWNNQQSNANASF